MAWKALLGLVLSLGNVSLLFAFDVYPWGKYDFKEYTDDLLDGLRENVQLKVWDSTLLKSLPSLSSSLLLKNSEGNTFELRQKGVEKALTVVPVQLDDFSAISEALQTSCALHTEGYWTYEWCHTKEVRQFHLEQKGNVLHREPDWSLGKQNRMVTIREKHAGDTTAEAKTRRITKIIEYFEDGQRCDETGEGRATEVHIVCCEGSAVKNFISAAAYFASADSTSSHGFKLPAGTIASITEPDLCTYEVTVCSPLMCKRPSEVLSSDSASSVAFKDTSASQLASVMKFLNSTCLNRQEDWWTYELCFNSGLRQVHYDIQQVVVDKKVTQKQLLLSQYQLGVAPVELYSDEAALKKSVSGPDRSAKSGSEQDIIREAGMVTPAFRMRGREPNFLRLEFLNGTPCDLDAVNRSAVVELYCGTKNRLVGIWEDSTCHYHVQVELSVLCTFTDFMPYKENTTVVEFIPFEPESAKSKEERLTTAVFAVEEPAGFSAEQSIDNDTPSVHEDDTVPVIEEWAVDEESKESKRAEVEPTVSDTHQDAVVPTEVAPAEVEAHAQTQNEMHFEGEEEWEKSVENSHPGDSHADQEQADPADLSELTYEENSSQKRTEVNPDHDHNSAASATTQEPIAEELLVQHSEETYTQDAAPVASDAELHDLNSAPAEGDHSEQVIEQTPAREAQNEEEKVSSVDVLNLVMQLEHAAAEMEVPMNLSRSAMVQLIETAIAQALVKQGEEGDKERTHQSADGDAEEDSALVMKVAFITDDGEETVVLGTAEIHADGEAEDDRPEGQVHQQSDERADESTEESGKDKDEENVVDIHPEERYVHGEI